jgi:hypothetical protein
MMRTRIARLLGLVVVAAAACTTFVPDDRDGGTAVWLDQNWTAEQRQWFHHASQGTATFGIPYEWFVALEQPRLSLFGTDLLKDEAYLAQFGFIASPRHAYNPDGLPVGFARGGAMVDPVTGQPWLDPATGRPFTGIGLTCAACHTGRLDYQGKTMVVDGGPAMTDLGLFRDRLGLAIGMTEALQLRFNRFANRVLGPGHSDQAAAELGRQLSALVDKGKAGRALEDQVAAASPAEGAGRLDALNRIGNEVFALQLGEPANFAAKSAPVAYPHIWGVSWFDWVQYNGSIQQPMVRNAGEAMGVRALTNLRNPERPLFDSTVEVGNLFAMEELLAGPEPPRAARAFTGLKAPKWPEHILPPIDRARAARGEALYAELCQGCHRPPVGSDGFWEARHWTRPNAAGEQYLKMPMIPLEEIGTDPATAADMMARTVKTPPFLGIAGNGFGPALGQVVEKTVDHWYDTQRPPVPAAQRRQMNGHRPNGIRALAAYKARPLDGIWATPPYLHNGAVPTLYALLSPVEERPARFVLGSREFDPVDVGYRWSPVEGGFELLTSERGNRNTGHEFRDGPEGGGVIGRALTVDERRALVEYLKTL